MESPQHPPPSVPPAAPPTKPAGPVARGAGPTATPDATGGLIPYKNPAALIGYYLGIFGLFPLLGFPLAVAAVILGVVGLRRRATGRAWGGMVHAWVAIVLGSISTLYNGFFLAVTLISFI